jgi:hypothetical protein
MLDRDKIVAVLERRFPGAAPGQIAAATNAIVGLDDEWEELVLSDWNLPDGGSLPCATGCCLWMAARGGALIKVFRKPLAN